MHGALTRREFAALSISAPVGRLLDAAALGQEVKLESELLFDLIIETRMPVTGVGVSGRDRVIVEVSGGTFNGPALKGTLIGPSGDWIEQRADGSSLLDVRLLLQTDDGQKIFTSWRGISYMPPGGALYARILPTFETRAPRYEWLNHIVSVGVYRPGAGRIAYRVFRIL